jgi:CRP-like cAMP-binding protein
MLDILNSFKSHPFLSRLSERDRMVLAAGAQPFHIHAGESLGVEGHKADAFYLVQSGEVSIHAQRSDTSDLEVQKIGPGDVLGWSWIIEPHTWEFTCRAETDVRGIKFDAYWLRHLCESDHEIGYSLVKQLVQVLARRLGAMRHAYGLLLTEHTTTVPV